MGTTFDTQDEVLEATRRYEALGAMDLIDAFRLRGSVVRTGDGVAYVVGLTQVGADELILFDAGAQGMAYDISDDATGVVLLSGADSVAAGQGAEQAGSLPSVLVGDDLLGRVIDPLGRALDDLPLARGTPRAVFREAPSLMERASVDRPLHTGILAIDGAIPIGRGQRQLILGDRNVGKTALALDIVAAQKQTGVLCVYVVIGQPLSRVLGIREALSSVGAMSHTVIVAADAADSPALQYLAPYSGTAVAESFREQGRDTVVIYDDLTKHADVYRELALLLGRPPGREAFPGDIFYIHGELLERATAFHPDMGGGSITAFPIVETTDNDISSYIPTNLISITDGQIYLDTTRFERNQRPAIDIGKSVSRIGGIAQSKGLGIVSKNLRIQVARFESLETITRVGLNLDPQTEAALERGRIVRALLRQPRFAVRSLADQVLALTASSRGFLDDATPAEAEQLIWKATHAARTELREVVESLNAGHLLDEAGVERFRKLLLDLQEHEGKTS